MQLACDAPKTSLVSAHAHKLSPKPRATLLTKEDAWSPLLSTLTGHTENVNAVAVSANIVVSGSSDKSVR